MKKKEQNAQETMNEAYLSRNGRDIWMSETRERERERERNGVTVTVKGIGGEKSRFYFIIKLKKLR